MPKPPEQFLNIPLSINVPSYPATAFSEGGLGPFLQNFVRVDPYSDYKIFFGPDSPFVSVEELFAGRTGNPFSAGTPWVRTYLRRFRVIVTDRTAGPAFVSTCPGLPVPFSPYIPYRRNEKDPDALAVNIRCGEEKDDEYASWIVDIDYSTQIPPPGPRRGKVKVGWEQFGEHRTPWTSPPVTEWDGESFTEYPLVDLNGKAYVNSAKQPFSPPPGFQKGDRVLTIVRYDLYFETRVEDYNYVTNSVLFKGFLPGYCLCYTPRAREMWHGSQKYFEVTYRIVCRKKLRRADGTYTPGFNPVRILNQGMFQRDTFFGVPTAGLAPIVKFGVQVNQPVLLDAEGLEQTATDANGNLIPTYEDFFEYRAVDLNQLLLGAEK